MSSPTRDPPTGRPCGRPWRQAMHLRVERNSPPRYPQLQDLEPGVKFFVLMLEQLGCSTLFSCEGHPRGFYIVFTTTSDYLVRELVRCGYFMVEVRQEPWQYRLSLDWQEAHGLEGRRWSQRAKNRLLHQAANAWTQHFGRLHALDQLKRPRSQSTS
jgi:hypothetical protein